MASMKRILDTVTNAYIEAIYFTDTGDTDQPDSCAELANETRQLIAEDCAKFISIVPDELITDYLSKGFTWDSFGHDFWLTRNGHGCGFWDRGINGTGEKLSDFAQSMGEVWSYQGDDGLIYLSK